MNSVWRTSFNGTLRKTRKLKWWGRPQYQVSFVWHDFCFRDNTVVSESSPTIRAQEVFDIHFRKQQELFEQSSSYNVITPRCWAPSLTPYGHYATVYCMMALPGLFQIAAPSEAAGGMLVSVAHTQLYYLVPHHNAIHNARVRCIFHHTSRPTGGGSLSVQKLAAGYHSIVRRIDGEVLSGSDVML